MATGSAALYCNVHINIRDPAITLLIALKEDWSLTGTLAVSNIRFSTGDFDDSPTKPYTITIEEDHSDNWIWELGYGTVRVDAVYKITVKVNVVDTSNKGRGWAKGYRFKLVQEVKKIIKANKTGLHGVWKMELRGRGRNINRLRMNPPILRYEQFRLIIYAV